MFKTCNGNTFLLYNFIVSVNKRKRITHKMKNKKMKLKKKYILDTTLKE